MSKPIKSIICGAGDMARKRIEAYISIESVEMKLAVPPQPEEAIDALKISLAALKWIGSGKKEIL